MWYYSILQLRFSVRWRLDPNLLTGLFSGFLKLCYLDSLSDDGNRSSQNGFKLFRLHVLNTGWMHNIRNAHNWLSLDEPPGAAEHVPEIQEK